MYLIVGLGNPEQQYSKTRHNMGFDVVNEIAKEYEINITKTKFNGLYGTGTIEGEKVILLKPQTYMNCSGESIIEFKNFYKIDNSEIIIIYDDIDLEPGNIRIRKKGSAGSHNGMKSVVNFLKTEEFSRIRVGIGKPEKYIDLVDHVLKKTSEDEYNRLHEGVIKAKEALTELIKFGIDSSMNKFNSN